MNEVIKEAPVRETILLGATVEWWSMVRENTPTAQRWHPRAEMEDINRSLDKQRAELLASKGSYGYGVSLIPSQNYERHEGIVVSVFADCVHVREESGRLWALALECVGLLAAAAKVHTDDAMRYRDPQHVCAACNHNRGDHNENGCLVLDSHDRPCPCAVFVALL